MKTTQTLLIIALAFALFSCNPGEKGKNKSDAASYQLPDVSATMDISSTAQNASKDIYALAGSEPASNVNYKHAPDDINTRYGKLEFPGGYPTEATIQKVYDELDMQRATQLYLDMYPSTFHARYVKRKRSRLWCK